MLRLVVYPSLGAAGVSVEVVDKRRRLVGKEFHIFVLPIENTRVFSVSLGIQQIKLDRLKIISNKGYYMVYLITTHIEM